MESRISIQRGYIIFIMNLNMLLRTLFASIKPLIKKKTIDKIKIITDKKEILKFIYPECLPTDAHGTLPNPFEDYLPKKATTKYTKQKSGYLNKWF